MKTLRPQTKRGQEGFSIVEAAVAVAIAGVLTSAALPAFRSAMYNAKLVEGQRQASATLRQLTVDREVLGVGAGTCINYLPEWNPTNNWSFTCNDFGEVQVTATSMASEGEMMHGAWVKLQYDETTRETTMTKSEP